MLDTGAPRKPRAELVHEHPRLQRARLERARRDAERAEYEERRAREMQDEYELRRAEHEERELGMRSVLVPGTHHLDNPRAPVRYTIDGLMAPGVIATTAGYPGSGKTPTELAKIDALLMGRPEFLGHEVRPLPHGFRVVYLTEESEYIFERKVDDSRISRPALELLDIAYWDRNFGIPWDEMVAEQVRRLGGCGLLVVDTALWWAGVLGENAENDSATMTALYRPLQLAAGSGLAVDVQAHTTKGVERLRSDADLSLSHVRGSGAVVAASGIVLGLKRPAALERQRDQRYFAILRDKLGGREESFYTRLTEEGIERIRGHAEAAAAASEEQKRVLEAIALLRDAEEPATSSAAARSAGMNKQGALEVIRNLKAEGRIRHLGQREGWEIVPQQEGEE